MRNFQASKRPSRLSRKELIAGMSATAVAAALPAAVSPALADAHSQERQIGQQVYNDLRKKGQIIDESPYYPVLREVGARISAAAAPHWYAMNFVVVKGNRANAFSVPGGWVYVNEALLSKADNQDELANVLGHETGHIVLGHVMNRIRQAQTANIIGGILGLFIKSAGQANLVNILGNYAFLNFSRQQEYQADEEGVRLAAGAGYNPWGTIWFFRKLEKLYGNAGFEQYVQDHPATSDRVGKIEALFRREPATFARFDATMPAPSGLAKSFGSDARISLVQS